MELKSNIHTSIARRRRLLWRVGEDLAAATLEEKGYSILERNWRAGRYEIDLIALQPRDLLVFVEVKTRIVVPEPGVSMHGLESITRNKKHKMATAATIYLHNNALVELGGRVDVIVVCYPRKPTAAHMTLDQFENLDENTLIECLEPPHVTHIEQILF